MRFLNYFRLTRPHNAAIAFISVIIAAAISTRFEASNRLLLAAFSAAFITAAANVINDIFDISIDKVNRPERVLASGKISVQSAYTFYLLLALVGLYLAYRAGPFLLLIAVAAHIMLYLYSYRLKGSVLAGNLMVSFVSGLAFIYGALAVRDFQAGIFPALFAFFFHLGRELIKDMQDVDGDLQGGALTFAGRYGKKKTALLVNIIFLTLCILLFVPYVYNVYSAIYLLIVLPGVALVLLVVCALIWKKNDSLWLGRMSTLLKVDMLIGLIAIYLGSHHDFFINY